MAFTLKDTTRQPVSTLKTLNEDGSTLFDFTGGVLNYLVSADTVHTDELKAHVATFVIANPGALFDKYSSNPGALALVENTLIEYKKGFIDLETGAEILYPAFYGRITHVEGSYSRTVGETLTVTTFDLMKNLLKQRVTTQPYYNTTINNITLDIMNRYGEATGFDLTPITDPTLATLGFFLAPDMSVVDILGELFDVPLFFVWFDYQGRLATRPRLGSEMSGLPNYTGFPDAVVPPGDNVSFQVMANAPTPTDSGIVLQPGQGFTLIAESVNNQWGPSPDHYSYPEGRYEIPPGSGLYPQTDIYDPLLCDPPPAGPAWAPTLRPQCLAVIVLPDGTPPTAPFAADAAIQGDRVVSVAGDDPRLPAEGGRIWLVLNDGTGAAGDNQGYFQCTINYGLAFVFEDAQLIETTRPSWQDHEFSNQTRCLGQALAERTGLGPSQVLTNIGDTGNYNFLSPGDGKTITLQYSSTNNASNILNGSQVYLKVYSPSFNNFGGPGYKYLFPTAAQIGTTNTYPVTADDGRPHVPGPFEDSGGSGNPSIIVLKSNGIQEGGIQLVAMSATAVKFLVYANSDGGGFEWSVEVHAQPVTVSNTTLTSIQDYDPSYVTDADLTAENVFSDNQVYQTVDEDGNSLAPLAMGTPCEVRVNPSTLLNTTLAVAADAGDDTIEVASITGLNPAGGDQIKLGSWPDDADYPLVLSTSGTTLRLSVPLAFDHALGASVIGLSGVVSADQLFLSDFFKVDFERGRIVFQNRLYLDFLADELYTGGSVATNSTNWSVDYIQLPAIAAPLSLYQSNRYVAEGGSFTYTLTGLQIGVGYLLRLHFADDSGATSSGQRVFHVLLNGIDATPSGIDCFQAIGGTGRAYALDIQGAAADNTGTLTIKFTNATADGFTPQGNPFVCGIELNPPSGSGAVLFPINAGGSAITVVPPTVVATYGYSQNQRQYGISSLEVNDPLLRTIEQCRNTGAFYLNQAAWQRNPITLILAASIPTLEPGQVIKAYHPRINSDIWLYLQTIHRSLVRPDVGASEGRSDYDELSGYLLFVRART